MPYKIQIEKHALKKLGLIPKHFKTQIKSKISLLSENPRPSGIKKLYNNNSIYRIRQGNYRIIYFIDDKEKLVKILKVGDRKYIYK